MEILTMHKVRKFLELTIFVLLLLLLVSCNEYSVQEFILQHTVEFNACGGEVSVLSKPVLNGEQYGDLPEVYRSGYEFLGWYTQEKDGLLITSDTKVRDVNFETLYAHWKEAKYIVSFDLGYEGPGIESNEVQYLNYYGPLPTPEREGWVFCGWKNDKGNNVYSYTISDYTCNHTLTAVWTQNYVVSFFDDQYYTETTDAHIAGSKKTDSQLQIVSAYLTLSAGDSISLPTLNEGVERIGFHFEGWKEEGGDETILNPGTDYTPSKLSTVFKACWMPNTVSVYLNTMGGASETNGIEVNYASNYGIIEDPTRIGFNFAGWFYSKSEASEKDPEKKVTSSSIVKNREAHTLFAAWTPMIYNITYLEQDGTAFSGTHGTGHPTSHTYNAATNLVAAQDNVGYKFDGWYTDSACKDNKVTVLNANAYTSDITLYAKWTPKTWNITYKDADNSNFSGQFSDTAPSKYTYDAETALVNPSKTGYIFDGWYTDSACKDNKVTVLNANAYTSDITLYAKWTPIVYTIIYNGNESTDGSTESSSHTYDVSKNLTVNGFNKTGYAFTGWNTKSDGSGTHYADCGLIKNLSETNGAEINLYAQWSTNTYTVKYDGNGSTGGTTAEQSNHVFASSQALTINGFVKTGYTFAGWNTESDGTGTSYTDGQSVTNLSSTAGDTVTLYAQWTANTYTIIYEGNGSTGGSTESGSHTYDADKVLTANGYTRTGYSFEGWSTTAEGSKAYDNNASVKNLSATNGATVTLYAKWNPISYTVSYDGNGSMGGPTASSSHTYDVNKNLTANGFTKTGYTFAGWATASDGAVVYTDGQSVSNLTTENNTTVTLYAKWTANNYSVIFDKNGADGTQIMPDQQFTYDETAKALSTNLFTKTGYKFIGWATTAGGLRDYDDNAPVQNLSENQNGTVTLYAKWLANNYTIKFNANGSTTISDTTGSLDDLPAQYDTPIDLTANTISRTGYTFAGWNTESDGTGTSYADCQNVNNLSSAVDGVVNLYAQWTPITYHVAFDNNTGTGTLATQDIKYDDTVNLTANNNAMTKVGYTFTGWNTNAAGGGTAYADGVGVNNLKQTAGETVTLYAQWSKNSYKVEFNNNGGSGSITTQDFTYDVAANLTANNGAMTKTGYTFNGWNTSADGNGSSYTDGQSVCNLSAINGATVTLYAKWKANTYTITYADYGDNKPFTGQFSGSVAGSHTYDTETILTTPTRTGYTLEGWYYKDSTSTYVELTDGKLGKTTFTSNITVYANWSPITYTIRFNANGDSTVPATGSIADLVATYGTEINLTKNETSGSNTVIARNYYDFAGWNTQADGNGYSYADEASVLNLANTQGAVINLYAKWTPQSWSITYKDAGDNALSADNAENVIATMPSAYSYGVTLKLQKPTKTGYTHAGWYTDSACSDSKVVTNYDLNGLSGNLVLYAKWTANQYDINYYNYDGSTFTGTHGSGYPTKHTYDSSTTLVDPTRTGYTFGGWYTSENGSTTKTSLGAKDYTAAINLYAKWTANTYNITYKDENDADYSGTHETGYPTTHTYGSTTTLKSSTRTGYTFGGWFTSSDCSGTAVTSISETAYAADFTLYAKWTANTYTVVYNGNGGKTEAQATTFEQTGFLYDVEKALADNQFSRPGYTFAGWANSTNTSSEGYKSYTVNQLVKNLTTSDQAQLYAVWTPKEYTVTFDNNGNGSFSFSTKQVTNDSVYGNLPYVTMNSKAYEFQGWYTQAEGGTKVTEDIVVSLTEDTTLYAHWLVYFYVHNEAFRYYCAPGTWAQRKGKIYRAAYEGQDSQAINIIITGTNVYTDSFGGTTNMIDAKKDDTIVNNKLYKFKK